MKKDQLLAWEEVQPLIKKGAIKTRQIGASAMWNVLEDYRPLQIKRFTILVPNISRGIVMRDKTLESLIDQQGHIIEDGYSRGELPELTDIFRTLIGLSEKYGTEARLSTPRVRAQAVYEFTTLIHRLDHPGVKKALRVAVIFALNGILADLEKGKIQGRIADIIRIVFSRLDEIGRIIPAIDHRRQDALEEVARMERILWLYAFKARVIRNGLKAKYVRDGILRYLREEVENPTYLGYRGKVIKTKRIFCLALGAIKYGKIETAEKLVNRAIQSLGHNPIDLQPIKSVE